MCSSILPNELLAKIITNELDNALHIDRAIAWSPVSVARSDRLAKLEKLYSFRRRVESLGASQGSAIANVPASTLGLSRPVVRDAATIFGEAPLPRPAASPEYYAKACVRLAKVCKEFACIVLGHVENVLAKFEKRRKELQWRFERDAHLLKRENRIAAVKDALDHNDKDRGLNKLIEVKSLEEYELMTTALCFAAADVRVRLLRMQGKYWWDAVTDFSGKPINGCLPK